MIPEHDGKRFHFPGGGPLASGWDALRWAVTRRPARWPAALTNPPAAPIEPRVPGDTLRVTFINHATVLIQTRGLNVLTDPVFSRRVSPVGFAGPARHRPPGHTLDALPTIDAVLISHGHYDHLDLPSLQALHERHSPTIIAPLNHGTTIRRSGASDVLELNWWDTVSLSDTVSVALVPARHWTSRRLGDANHALWGGFVLNLPGGSLYFAGDTGYGDGQHFIAARERLGPFRLALLPIGAYEPRWFMQPQHMNPAEAVQACLDLQARHALGIHFGTFQLTDEAHDAPAAALAAALHDTPELAGRFRLLDNGGCWDVPAVDG